MQTAFAVFALFQCFWTSILSEHPLSALTTSPIHIRGDQSKTIGFEDFFDYYPGQTIKFDLKTAKIEASVVGQLTAHQNIPTFGELLNSRKVINAIDAGQSTLVLFQSPPTISWLNTSRLITAERSLKSLELESSMNCSDAATHIKSQSLLVACTQWVSTSPPEEQPYLPKQKTVLMIISILDGTLLASLAFYQPKSYLSTKGTRIKWLDDAQTALVIYSSAGGDLTANVDNLGLLACRGFNMELDKVQCSWIENVGNSQLSGVSLSSLHEVSPLLSKTKAPQYKIMLSGRTPEWNFTSYVECSINFPIYISCGEVLPYTKGLTFQLDETTTGNYDSRTGVLQIGPSPYNLTAVCPQFDKVFLPEGSFVRDVIKSRQFLIIQVVKSSDASMRQGHIILDTATKRTIPFLDFTEFTGAFILDTTQTDDLQYVYWDPIKKQVFSAKIGVHGVLFPAVDQTETQEGELTITADFLGPNPATKQTTTKIVRWATKWGKPQLTAPRHGLPAFQLLYKAYYPLPLPFTEIIQGNNITLSLNETNEMAAVVDYQMYASAPVEFFLRQQRTTSGSPEQFSFGEGYVFAVDVQEGEMGKRVAGVRLSACEFPNDRGLVCSEVLVVRDRGFEGLSEVVVLASARGGVVGQFYGVFLKALNGSVPVLVSVYVRGASVAVDYSNLESDAVVKSAKALGMAARDGQVMIAGSFGIKRTKTSNSDYILAISSERSQDGPLVRNKIPYTALRPICDPLVALTYWTTPDRIGLSFISQCSSEGSSSSIIHHFELDGTPKLTAKIEDKAQSINQYCQLSATQAIIQYGAKLAWIDTSGMLSSFSEVDYLAPSSSPHLLCKDGGMLVAITVEINSTLTEVTMLDLTTSSSLRQVHSHMKLAGSWEEVVIHNLQDRALVTHFKPQQGLTGFSAFKLWPKILLDITPKLGFNFTAKQSDRLLGGDNFLVAVDQLNQTGALKMNMSVFDQNYTITHRAKQAKQKLGQGRVELEGLLDVNGPVRMMSLSGPSASQVTLQQRLSQVAVPFSDPNPVFSAKLTQVIRANFSVFSVAKSQEPLDGADTLTFYVHLKNSSHNATARFTSIGSVRSVDIVENYRNNIGYAVIVEQRAYTLGSRSMVSVAPINGSKINWYGGTREPIQPILAKAALDELYLSLLIVEHPSTLAIYQATWRNLTGSWPFKRNFTIEDVTDVVALSSPEGFIFVTHSNLSYTTSVYSYSLQTQKITQWDTQAFYSENSPLKSQILQFLKCRQQSDGIIRCVASVLGAYLVEFVLDPIKFQVVSQHKHMKFAESFIQSTDILISSTDNSCYILASASFSKLGIGIRQQDLQMWRCGDSGFKMLDSLPISEKDQPDPLQTYEYPWAAFEDSIFVGSLNKSAPVRKFKVGSPLLLVSDLSKVEISQYRITLTGETVERVELKDIFTDPSETPNNSKPISLWTALLAVFLVAGSLGLFFLLGKFVYKPQENKAEDAYLSVLEGAPDSAKGSFKENNSENL